MIVFSQVSPHSMPGVALSDGNAVWPRVIDTAAVRLIMGGSQPLGEARSILYTDLLTGKSADQQHQGASYMQSIYSS